jgi:pSer/pThr/pTyr-binding forkhead associated (FHA) protein
LTGKSPEQTDSVFAVRGEMTVGREGCDITLLGGHASRNHAKLSVAGGVLRVEDLGSTNGTFVNDERVETAELKPGDEVRFDTEAFIVGGPRGQAAEDDKKTVLRPSPAADTEAEPGAKPSAEAKPPVKKKTGAKKKKKASAGKAAAKKAGAGKPDAGKEKPEADAKSQDDVKTRVVAGKKPQTDEPPKAAEEKQAPPEQAASGEAAEPGRKAWYERETPQGTRQVEAQDLRDQLQEGGTQVVRGVGSVEMPSLIGTTGEWSGHVINLDKETMTIGRANTDILLDEPSVSTKHAQIVHEGDRWKVVDLMSANGVYVIGKKTQVAFLSPGDAVRFGRLELRFVTDSTDVSSRAAPEPDQGEIIKGARGSGKDSSWLYVAIGFIVIVVAAGAYLFLAG